MELIFEKSVDNRGCDILPPSDVPVVKTDSRYLRRRELHLPEMSETDISRHYTELAKRTYGINNGFYPLGSCTMKYNPKINEEIAKLPGFSNVHPLQPENTIQGCLKVMKLTENYLCEITGMDYMTFQPAAGAHGEFTGLKLIRAYHENRKDNSRTEIIVPDSAHGTNPASAAMAGFSVINISSTKDGYVDLEELKKAAGEHTAGFMLTNPNTVGMFDKNILEITQIIHDAGGLCYYDGANLNPIMGIARPGDMGFDVVHLNLHKTFSTPHGGGGPGGGPVGCKSILEKYLPTPRVRESEESCDKYELVTAGDLSIGRVKEFYGNFLVVVKALTYILTLGRGGLKEASENAVLNANYMMNQLKDTFHMPFAGPCMHEFVMSLEELKKETKVSALDVAKTLLDYGIHPPTMYFPLIVHEALMLEPTETESKETLDQVIAVFKKVREDALMKPESLTDSPKKTPIGRPDEVTAARNPVLRYLF
ncbi:aminomethyl-transferring glycine dehydrogenase subunit GcvPB [Anaerocolumna sp. MB42-C2]|uniref:aminomethyl-transferring glycine dehydrogenase subunit GcvPB n=1 Tax=Anaerocolumna sp. MB42-C2 TaxID=3070997 RepID=UPI0027DF4833|nr:aminomethyl-transferring glycine dehydrogenase subunit GcvPB [Anaerocolumna sp. MB42-C2]WMJ88758.1 aminomethyl-transferring glycine dehydrogenase subunit GcvPB [Anaerocolumna sp. MB42-C2]